MQGKYQAENTVTRDNKMIYQILKGKSVLITVTCLHSEIDTPNVSHNDKRYDYETI